MKDLIGYIPPGGANTALMGNWAQPSGLAGLGFAWHVARTVG
jgi:hypothetical protein